MRWLAVLPLLLVAGCGSSATTEEDPLEHSNEQPTSSRIWDPEPGVRCYIVGENSNWQSMSCLQNQDSH